MTWTLDVAKEQTHCVLCGSAIVKGEVCFSEYPPTNPPRYSDKKCHRTLLKEEP